ncbi:MAG TPA: hypothetical protein VII83_08120 [Gaiellaceae bacterium]
MSDRSTDERLFKKATTEDLLNTSETTRGEVAPAQVTRQISPLLSPLMLVVITVLDLGGVALLLAVNPVAGAVVFAFSGVVLAIWLNLRLIVARASALKEQERERASR